MKLLNVLDYILDAAKNEEKLLAILIDPDKINSSEDLDSLCIDLTKGKPDLIFIGGSLINNGNFNEIVNKIKSLLLAPVVIFPGNNKQIEKSADAILLLSLISGRNPEFLIGQHVLSSFDLKKSGLEIISTGYMLVDCGNKTSASYMSNTQGIPYTKNGIAAATALAGEQLGNKIIYLDGGSGAKTPISPKMIKIIKETISIPLIVGGGIKTIQDATDTWNAGADLIVIGTAFENNPDILVSFQKIKSELK